MVCSVSQSYMVLCAVLSAHPLAGVSSEVSMLDLDQVVESTQFASCAVECSPDEFAQLAVELRENIIKNQ